VAGVVAIPTATALGLVLGAASLGFIAGGRPDLGGWWGGAVRAFVEPPRVEVPRDAGAEFIQGAPNTCGLAALAYSLNLLGFDTREADLLARVSPSPEGASMADLVALARAEGLVAWGERQDVTALRSIPKPVLAHVDDRHWVVVLAFDGDEVQLFDPAHGHTTLSVSDFTRRWGGHALLLRLPSYDDAASVHAAGIGTEQRPHGG